MSGIEPMLTRVLNRNINSSTAACGPVLINYKYVFHWSAEIARRHGAVDTTLPPLPSLDQ